MLAFVPATGPYGVRSFLSPTAVLAHRHRLPLRQRFPLRTMRSCLLLRGCRMLRQWSTELDKLFQRLRRCVPVLEQGRSMVVLCRKHSRVDVSDVLEA